MKQLIVNGDDFGRSPGINQGILDSHLNGILTSTTVMINFDDAPVGLERALTEAPDLGIGLHLNLTEGIPVSSVPTLVDERGQFFPVGEWLTRFDRIDADDLRREICAQFERFVSLTGHVPDHLDAHHHITYLHPVALDVMLTIAEEHHLPLRNGNLTLPPDEAMSIFKGMFPTVPEQVGSMVYDALQSVLAQHPAPFWPARFETGFFDVRATLGDLLVILTTLPEDSITEIMCHPRHADNPGDIWGTQEVLHLTHRATLECVKAEGIQLIRFGDIQL